MRFVFKSIPTLNLSLEISRAKVAERVICKQENTRDSSV